MILDKDGLDPDRGDLAPSPMPPHDDSLDLDMPVGESASSPLDGDTAPLNVSNNESGDEGPRKRSASPATANEAAWGDNPAKKICTEGIGIWVQSTSEAPPPDVTQTYQENHDMLISMGFNSDEIDTALRMSNNEVEKAIQYLTREITGLDAASKPSSSVDKPKHNNFALSEILRQFVDSDDEEVADDKKLVWDDEPNIRLRTIIDGCHRFVIFRKNGTLHRRIIIATNIIRAKKHERMPDVLNFVDEIISYTIGRHVNCSDVRPGFEVIRQLLDLQPPYVTEAEAARIEQFYLAITPLLCARLTVTPCSVKTVLSIDEMFNYRNKFFMQGVALIDPEDRVYPPLKYMDIERLDRLEHKRIYAYFADVFVEALIPMVDEKMDVENDEIFFEVTLLDLQVVFRTINIFSNYMYRNLDIFLCKVETWIAKALDRYRIVNDKEIRDALIRRQGLDLLQEIVVLCDRTGLDVATTTQAARLDYLQKWIKCPQMESILHALEELGTIADRFHRTGGMTITRPRPCVNEEFFKKWLEKNKVLQIVLTGNMDHVVYVERIQPILQYMTPELTLDDIKFIWSLRKGRMGVSVENFNKIMEFISRSVNNEQIEWLIELFKKSFRSRETRLIELIFNLSYTIAIQKDRDDECKLKICNAMWELIFIARGPPRAVPFKSIEHGMKKHCELLNMMFDKTERDAFLANVMDSLCTDESFNEIVVYYLFIMLEKLKRLCGAKKSFHDDQAMARLNDLKSLLRERRLADPILSRLEHIRQVAHDQFDAQQQISQDSMSNAVFESTNDLFNGHHVDNILSTVIYGCTEYAFILQNALRLLKWLHDMDASIVDVEYVQRLFNIFIERPDSSAQERTEIFGFLFEIRMALMRPETSRAIITHLCAMDMFTLQITGLRCFCKYWEELPILSNEESRPVESFIVKKDNECKLFVWKLILFNQYDDVVEKCMETFCERDLVLVESPWSVRHHTYSFLSVFSFYVEKLKSELYKRNGKPNTEIKYDTTELDLNDEEIEQHHVPLDDMLTETITRALNRLVRFMTRFVDQGNEKNHMIRENPSHGSSISGHPVTFSIELKNDDEDMDCGLISWKTLVCDSSTTVGEFKVRLAKRLMFHEGMTEFTVHKRDEDTTYGEAHLRYDFLTLQNVKLATETDSMFLSEKLRLLVKPKKSSRRSDLQNQQLNQKKALREDFLPMAVISRCNFYDLLHELSSIGDKHIRASVRRLLLLLPTQPYLLKQLTMDINEQEDHEIFRAKVKALCESYMIPTEPGRMLYALEAISSIVAPTRMTEQAVEHATDLITSLLDRESNVINTLITEILTKPHVIPLNKCSASDRHSIFERILQIVRSVLTGHNTFIKMVRNENRIREEMRKTCDRMIQSRQTPRPIDPNMEFALTKQQIMPPPVDDNQNNPARSTTDNVLAFREDYTRTIALSLKNWNQADVLSFLECIRNFIWIHVATESLVSREIDPYREDSLSLDASKPTASDLIRSVFRGDRWGDECRLIVVKKAFSVIRHILREWVHREGDEAIPLLETLFLDNGWVQFYQDVLVNSQQEGYRKYQQEHLVKIGKDSYEITTHALKMLINMFMVLPLHEGHTSDLDELQKRQRHHCDNIIQTMVEIFFYETPRRCRDNQKDLDWSHIGHKPIDVVRGQINSVLKFKPSFSTTNNDTALTESVYAASKMRMINCLLPYCTQDEVEGCPANFVDSIINDFLFPELPDIEDSMLEEESKRWDYQAREAAIQTINAFCERSYINSYKLLLHWDKFTVLQKSFEPSYRPIVRPKAFDKVGLKNDGGTCYMNAMIQQLVHVPGLCKDLIALRNIDPTLKWGDSTSALLCELQRVFAQLNFAQCQAIIPYGLWREFRFEPDVPLNTKQHHDAIDFYSILLDKCDYVLKKLELPPLFQNKFFGKYSYEKICYGCWHRYNSPNEEFNCISLALSGDNLGEALENFLAAHVMEGDNAYHCEKCNEKKTTLNRSSFLELPSTMTIQLKRFTYDLVNNMIKKDNQFFSFPFEIDMTPYMTTSRHVPDEHVQDLFEEMLYGNIANDEPASPPPKNGATEKSNLGAGSASTPSLESAQKKLFRRHRSSTMRLSQSFANTAGFDTPTQQKPMIYELVGVLAHSGIATAGHYYSFIKERRDEYKDSPTYGKWYHVNDMYVSPMSHSNIEDIWYGGTFTQDGAFVGIDERIRHWNAYVLFYEKKQDDMAVSIPRHISDPQSEVKPKVTFDVTDELMDDVEARVREAEEALKIEMSEARKLRIRMFESADYNLKKFLNDEYCKFLDDRDFFAFDLYQMYINSLLPLLRREENVKYNVTEIGKMDFFKISFEYIASYVIRVAWMMFDEARPKSFPRSATELIKILLQRHPDNKVVFFKILENNNSEMLNRLLETTEHDVRTSFWQCMRIALRLWVVENGNKDENMLDPSPDSTDLDDDDEDEDDEDEDDDLEDEDSETEEMMRPDIMRPNPMALVNQLVMNQARAPQLKPMLPVDLSKSRSQRVSLMGAMQLLNSHFQLNIVRRIVQILPYRIHRMEGSGRHYSRSLVEILYMISRLNDFGRGVLQLCQALPLVAEFLWEDYSTVFCRLRFSEDRIKNVGLWPILPGLYFELLLDTMNKSLQHIIDPHMHFRHAVMTTQGKFVNETLVLYCASREEHETTEGKSVNDEKALHNRIVMCYVRQIQLISRSEQPDAVREYIFSVAQILLKAFLKEFLYMFTSVEHWSHVVEFFSDLAVRLTRVDLTNYGCCVLKNFLFVGVAEDDDAVQHGVLPVLAQWHHQDPHKYRKMSEALFNIRVMKQPDLRIYLNKLTRRFSPSFSMSTYEDLSSDDPMDDMDDDEVMIGPQLAPNGNSSTSSTPKESEAVATARVIETKEINLEEELKTDEPAPVLEMIEQPSLEEVLNVEAAEEDLNMMLMDDLTNEEAEK